MAGKVGKHLAFHTTRCTEVLGFWLRLIVPPKLNKTKQNYANQWTETVLAKDYIKFLDLLWRRVRPDLLFQPPPQPDGGKRPPPFSATPLKVNDEDLGKKGKKNRRGQKNDNFNDDGSINRRQQMPIDDFSHARGTRGGVGGVLGRYRNNRPPPPPPVLPPSTVDGLVLLHIPGFQPKEAQRAPWVLKGGFIDPAVRQALAADLARADGGNVHRSGGEIGEKAGGARAGQKQPLNTEMEQPNWKERRRKRLLAAGMVEGKKGSSGRKGKRGRQKEEKIEEMDSIRNFIARNFPEAAREVTVRVGEKGGGGGAMVLSTAFDAVRNRSMFRFVNVPVILAGLPLRS